MEVWRSQCPSWQLMLWKGAGDSNSALRGENPVSCKPLEERPIKHRASTREPLLGGGRISALTGLAFKQVQTVGHVIAYTEAVRGCQQLSRKIVG